MMSKTTAGTLTGPTTALLATGETLHAVKSYDGIIYCGWGAGTLYCSEDGAATWYKVGR
jgi:hypothetical protein